jgi:TP901 family phage tail tape measure protein
MFGRNVINLGVAIQLEDQFSRKAREVTESMLHMNTTALKLARNADKMASTGFNMLAAGGAMLYPLGNAINVYAEYGHTLAQIGATVESLTNEQFKALDHKVKEVGMNSVYSVQEIANATRELARQGMPYEVLLKSIGSINDVAQATGTSLQTVSEFYSSMLAIYPETLKNTDRLSSQMVYAANKSRASVDALQNSFNYMGASARQMNMPVSHSLALLMRLADAGLKGSQGGTVADNFIRFYAKSMGPLAGKRQLQGLSMMGLSQKDFQDAEGNLLSVDKALQLIGSRLKMMKSKDAQSAVSAAFGERGKRAFITVEQAISSAKSMEGYINGLEQVQSDYASKQSAKVVDNIWGDIARLKDALMIMKLEVIEPLEPVLRLVTQAFTKAVNIATYLGSTKIGSGILMLTAGIGSALVIYGAFNLLVGKGIKFIVHYAFGWRQWKNTAVGGINAAAAALMRLTLLQQRSAALTQIQAQGLRYSHTSALGVNYWRGANGRFARGPQGGASFGGGALFGMGALGNTNPAVMQRAMAMRYGATIGGMLGSMGSMFSLIGRWAFPILSVVSLLGLAADALGLFKTKTDEAKDALDAEKKARSVIMERVSMNRSWQVTGNQADQMLGKQQYIIINVDGEEKIKKLIDQSDRDTYHSISFE